MLTICFDHLEAHKMKVLQVSKDKEVWKQHIMHIGLPHYQVVLKFSMTHLEWWNIRGSLMQRIWCETQLDWVHPSKGLQ